MGSGAFLTHVEVLLGPLRAAEAARKAVGAVRPHNGRFQCDSEEDTWLSLEAGADFGWKGVPPVGTFGAQLLVGVILGKGD